MEHCTYIRVVLPQTAQMILVPAHTVAFVQLVLEACLWLVMADLRLAHAGHCSLNRQIQS